MSGRLGVWIPGKTYRDDLHPWALAAVDSSDPFDVSLADKISRGVIQKRGGGYRVQIEIESADDARELAHIVKDKRTRNLLHDVADHIWEHGLVLP